MAKMTIADIAREAGVSKSTVSRYLNKGYVKEDTRRRIQEVVLRTGYEPSAAAQNLKLKETRTVGIVAPTMTSTTCGRQITSMVESLRQDGYSCIILTTDHDPQREIEAVEYLRSLRADGIILIATNISKEHQKLQYSSSVPFLVMGQEFRQGTSVIYDDYHAGQDVGAYARKKGHRDVVYVGVDKSDDAIGIKRRQGVLEGLGPDARVIELNRLDSAFSYDATRKLVREQLEKHVPTLFVCATDRMGYACYKEVRDKGFRVPEDVSIIGFGGYELSELLSPALTTVRFHNEEAGFICARTLVAMIHNEPVASLQTIGYSFLEGESVRDLANV